MSLTNRLTEFLGIKHPVLLAPMAMISGGLGVIGGGYGDAEWLQHQFDQAGAQGSDVGSSPGALARDPELLDMALARQPVTIMLSFGDPQPFADRIRAA